MIARASERVDHNRREPGVPGIANYRQISILPVRLVEPGRTGQSLMAKSENRRGGLDCASRTVRLADDWFDCGSRTAGSRRLNRLALDSVAGHAPVRVGENG